MATKEKSPTRLVPTIEAAAMLGISRQAFAQRCRRGDLRRYRDPSDYRVKLVDLGELERYMGRPRRIVEETPPPAAA